MIRAPDSKSRSPKFSSTGCEKNSSRTVETLRKIVLGAASNQVVRIVRVRKPLSTAAMLKELKKLAREMARIEALAAIRKANPWIEEMSVYRSVPAQRAMLSATRVFGFAEMLFNKRITNEELGDALESIAKHLKGSNPVWWAYIKLITTMFWLTVNAVKEVKSAEKKGA